MIQATEHCYIVKNSEIRAWGTVSKENVGGNKMNKVMQQPSYWLPNGIKFNLADQFRPFSFNEELQVRLEELLEKNKERLLTPEEEAELAGLLELNRILSFINAKLAA